MIVKLDYFPNFAVIDMTFFLSCSCWSPENSVDSIETIYWCYSKYTYFIVVVVQLLSCVWLFMTPWTAAYQACLSTISRSLLKFMSIEFGDAVQPSHLLPPTSPLTFNLSQHESLFQWGDFLHQVVSIGASASASVLPMNIQGWFPLGLTGLISLPSKRL